MAYQVIARKYRPQRFDDVVGQEHVTQTLANAVKQNRIAHAYLFCGPRGTGKTTIARIFAKCLNCTGGPRVEFDDTDPRCLEIAEGRAIDVLEIDGASNNGVEQVRELRETCKYAPASSKFKIYIIDEVHMLSTAAFNALLKTLEEPPAHVKFMFATTDPEKVLATILSRCQRFDLRRIPVSLIVKHLTAIARKEKVKIDQAALYAVARGADGGMRDAESALDQLISFCGDKIEEGDVLSMFGLTAQSHILALVHGVLQGDAAAVLRELNDLSSHGKDLGRLLSDLLNYFRNLLIYQVSKGDFGLIEVSEAEAGNLKEHSAVADAETLTRIMEVFAEAEGRLRDAASKKIFLEVTLLRAIEARNAVSIDSVLKQLDALRPPVRQGEGGAPVSPAPGAPVFPPQRPVELPPVIPPLASAPAPTLSAAEEAVPEPTAPVAAPSDDRGQLWTAVVEAVGRARPLVKSYLTQAFPLAMDKGVLTVGFDPEFADQMDLVNTPQNQLLIQTKLGEMGHGGVSVRFVKAERLAEVPPSSAEPVAESRPPSAPIKSEAGQVIPAVPAKTKTVKPGATVSPASATSSEEDFKNDPLIQRALEEFKGHIVEVRP
jgi:DNA polymerase-3 subunit gamma/tau